MNFVKTSIIYLLFLLFISVVNNVNAYNPGINGPYCDDPKHAVEPQIVEPGQQIKFLSSGHNRVFDLTTGGLVIFGPLTDEVYQQRAVQKLGTVLLLTSYGQLFLERVHAVNENGKNVDYYTTNNQCGVYSWYHGWECNENGNIIVCQCMHTVQFQVCAAGGNLPTNTPIPQSTAVPTYPPIEYPTNFPTQPIKPTQSSAPIEIFTFPTTASQQTTFNSQPTASTQNQWSNRQLITLPTLDIFNSITRRVSQGKEYLIGKTGDTITSGKNFILKIITSFFQETAF